MNDQSASTRSSIDQHVKARVVELGQSLETKTAIYLDLNFWITLQKETFGIKPSAENSELLRALRAGVANGDLFCPASESVFLELLKQSDPSSRLETAQLIDELSLGVTLLSGQARLATEVAHFFQGFKSGADALHPLRHLVWSKLSYVLGFVHPEMAALDADTMLSVQKQVFDYLWTIPLSVMIERIGELPDPETLRLNSIAAKLNEGNQQHAGGLRSFEQARKDELRGIAGLCAEIGADVFSNMAEKEGITPPVRGSSSWEQSRTICANAVFHALASRPETRLQLPLAYVEAMLHAAMRWDKARRIKGNDIYDFNHASAALGYCTAFLTERPLRILIESNHVGLDKQYPCRVISDVTEAVEYVVLHLENRKLGSANAQERI